MQFWSKNINMKLTLQNENQIRVERAQADLLYRLSINEDFWQPKANIKLLKEGDANINFFHSTVKKAPKDCNQQDPR